MVRAALVLILIVFVAHAFWRLVDGVIAGLGGRGRRAARRRGPVCGTFVVPERALTLVVGSERVFFCSAGCRDRYRARTA